MVPFAIIDEKNYQKFLEPGNPRIWDDKSNPMDIMGRPGLFLSLLKEGKSASPHVSYTQRRLPIIARTNNTPSHAHRQNCLPHKQHQPPHAPHPSLPPTISIHGSADSLIRLSDPYTLKSALDKLGIANELVIVEGADHGLMPEEARGEEWPKAVAWLERWV